LRGKGIEEGEKEMRDNKKEKERKRKGKTLNS
jgi:hypothetical protein